MTQSDTLRTRITALRQVYAPWTLGVQRQLQMLAGQHGRTIPLEDMRIRQKISLQFRSGQGKFWVLPDLLKKLGMSEVR